MSLKIVPQPEGFELRDARSDKNRCAADWLPADALYDASVEIAEKGAFGTVAVVWYERNDQGQPVVRWRIAESDPRLSTALLADALFAVQRSQNR
jgi:hypothetical protein